MFICRKDLWLSSLELKTLRLQVDENQTGTGGHTGLCFHLTRTEAQRLGREDGGTNRQTVVSLGLQFLVSSG